MMRATAIVRTKSSGSSLARGRQRRAFDLHQHIDRHAFRMDRQAGECRDHADAILQPLAHADNAAAADMDAGRAHVLERIETILVSARGDDRAVKFRRGVEVVIVVVEAGLFQPLRLIATSACRAWRRSPGRARFTPSTMAQTLSRSRSLGERQAAPMQKREAPPALAARASLEHRLDAHQLLGLDAGVVARGLRAIGAILRAAAGLDRQQSRDLHFRRIEILPVDRGCAEHQFRERQVEQRPHLGAGPIVPKQG